MLNCNVSSTLINSYKFIGFFSFGAVCCQLTTEVAKYSIGRFRPHFLSVSTFVWYHTLKCILTDSHKRSCQNYLLSLFFIRNASSGNFFYNGDLVNNPAIHDTVETWPNVSCFFSIWQPIESENCICVIDRNAIDSKTHKWENIFSYKNLL